MKVVEVVWHLLLSPLYLLIFLLSAAPGVIKGTIDVVTAPFVVLHEECHLRVARLLGVEYQQVTPLMWKFPRATGKEMLFINLAPLVLVPLSLLLFEVWSRVSSWWSFVILLVAVGIGRYSLPSRGDLVNIRSEYSLSVAHVLLLPLVLVLYVVRFPRRFSVLLDYLTEVAWVACLYLAVEYWGSLLSVVPPVYPF